MVALCQPHVCSGKDFPFVKRRQISPNSEAPVDMRICLSHQQSDLDKLGLMCFDQKRKRHVLGRPSLTHSILVPFLGPLLILGLVNRYD